MAEVAGQASSATGTRRRKRRLSVAASPRSVAEAMVTCPTVHGPSATVGELRTFFRDDHVHAALIVDEGVLIGVVERRDLGADASADLPARAFAQLDGRTAQADAAASETLETMTRAKRRRLAVVGYDGRLLGLLCLKASGRGFCSDGDVSDRRSAPERFR